jgi:tetratricopeptide (TPR) repeat protein
VSAQISAQSFPDEVRYIWPILSKIFEGLRQYDSALLYAKKAYEKANGRFGNSLLLALGNAFSGKANYDSALFYYRISIRVAMERHQEREMIDGYNGIAGVYKVKGSLDSAVWYAKKTLTEKITKTYPAGLLKAANILADIYQSQNKPDSTLKYLRIAIDIKDSLFNREKTIAIKNLSFKEKEKEKIETSSSQHLKEDSDSEGEGPIEELPLVDIKQKDINSIVRDLIESYNGERFLIFALNVVGQHSPYTKIQRCIKPSSMTGKAPAGAARILGGMIQSSDLCSKANFNSAFCS